MDKFITIYHGSKQIVDVPTFGLGRKNNDFGLGFYCTESIDLAKEWAVSSLSDGYANRYTLDTEYLNILNLNSPDYTILNWMAVLVEHRVFSIKTPADGKEGPDLEEALSDEAGILSSGSYGANPEKVLIDRENFDFLQERIETELSPLEKQVLDLHLTGMNYIEIAHILNRDEKSTDNALQRIRTKVRSWQKRKQDQ